VYKHPLSYSQIDAQGLHEVLLNQHRNHEEIVVDFEKLASSQLLNKPVLASILWHSRAAPRIGCARHWPR